MNVISEVLDHVYIKVLSIVVLMSGFVLDALGKSEYFYLAFIVVVVVVFVTFLNVLKTKKVYEKEILPVPVVINIDSNDSAKYVLNKLFVEIEKKSEFEDLKENLKKYKNVVEDDLVFTYSGDIYNKEKLISFLQIIKYQITKIKENIPNKVEFHLAYYKRPAIAFMIGYLFEAESVVIYQKNPDGDIFDEIARPINRNYKVEVNEYAKFDVINEKSDANSSKVLFALKASSHEIALNAESLSQYSNIVYMKAKHNGTIGIEEDWILYAREIFTQLQYLRTQYKHITMVHNMPESIAIIVGMAIGNYWDIEMTQYDRGEYLPIMKLDEMKCYF